MELDHFFKVRLSDPTESAQNTQGENKEFRQDKNNFLPTPEKLYFGNSSGMQRCLTSEEVGLTQLYKRRWQTLR